MINLAIGTILKIRRIKMTKTNLEEIINHLEFLGYEIKEIPNEGNNYLGFATNTDAWNFSINSGDDNTTIIMTRLIGFQEKALKSVDFYSSINEINATALSKWYFEHDPKKHEVTIVVEADYYSYNKSAFADFIKRFDREIDNNFDKVRKFWKEK